MIEHYEQWLGGPASNFGITTFSTELWGIYRGLKLAWDRGFRDVIMETDSRVAYEGLSRSRPNWIPWRSA